MKRIALTFVLLAAAAAVFAQADLQVLAVVKLNAKSEPITVKQLKTRVEAYQKQTGKSFTVDEKKKILDAMIEEKLVVQAAQKAGITVSDSVVDSNFLQGISQQLGKNVTEAELSQIVQQQTKLSLDDYMKQQVGMDVADYKAYLKSQLIAQQYIVSQNQNELKEITPSDDEIRAFYELNKTSFVQSDMFKMFLVMVPKGKDPEGAKAKANEMLNAYKDKKMTLDQISVKAKVENSGFQAGEILVNKSEKTAYQLGIAYQDLLTLFTKDEGYLSNLVEKDTNFQFYTITQKYSAKMLTLSDVVQPGTTVTVYDYIKRNLGEQKQMEYLQTAAQKISDSLNTDANVERKKTGASLDKLLDWEGTK